MPDFIDWSARMVRLRQLISLIGLLALGACGGGEGSSTSVPAPSPAPNPTPAPTSASAPAVACASGWRYVNPTTNLNTPTAFLLSEDTAGKAIDVQMKARVEANNIFEGHFLTGRLRLSLWAVASNGMISANGVTGQLIARAPASAVGGQGVDSDRLYNASVAFVQISTRGTTPKAGTYCIALVAEEETATGALPCASNDRFCVNGWYVFDNAITFK